MVQGKRWEGKKTVVRDHFSSMKWPTWSVFGCPIGSQSDVQFQENWLTWVWCDRPCHVYGEAWDNLGLLKGRGPSKWSSQSSTQFQRVNRRRRPTKRRCRRWPHFGLFLFVLSCFNFFSLPSNSLLSLSLVLFLYFSRPRRRETIRWSKRRWKRKRRTSRGRRKKVTKEKYRHFFLPNRIKTKKPLKLKDENEISLPGNRRQMARFVHSVTLAPVWA